MSTKKHKLKRLSLKGMRLKDALKLATQISLDGLKKAERQEKPSSAK